MGNHLCSSPNSGCNCRSNEPNVRMIENGNELTILNGGQQKDGNDNGKEPKPLYRGQRMHRFPIAMDSYVNCSYIECACCGKNLRTCDCDCELSLRCLCAGPLNYHRHDYVSFSSLNKVKLINLI